MTPSLPNELYDKKSLYTLSGAALGVWLFTNVIGYIFEINMDNYKWVGLVIALVISYVGAVQVKKMDLNLATVAFFNALLIFVSASGINSINQGADMKKQYDNPAPSDSTSISQENNEAALIPFTDKFNWWIPVDIQEQNILLKSKITELSLQLETRKTALDSSNHLLEQARSITTRSDAYDQLIDTLAYFNEMMKLKDQSIALLKENSISDEKTQSTNDCRSDLKSANKILSDLIKINSSLLESVEEYLKAGNMDPRAQRDLIVVMNEKANTLKNDLKDNSSKLEAAKNYVKSKL